MRDIARSAILKRNEVDFSVGVASSHDLRGPPRRTPTKKAELPWKQVKRARRGRGTRAKTNPSARTGQRRYSLGSGAESAELRYCFKTT